MVTAIGPNSLFSYCDEEYAAPELLPLNGNGLRLVAEAAISNTTLRTLSIVGHEGYVYK